MITDDRKYFEDVGKPKSFEASCCFMGGGTKLDFKRISFIALFSNMISLNALYGSLLLRNLFSRDLRLQTSVI